MQAQREASNQIAAANQSVEDARADASGRIDQIRDYYDGRSEEEFARDEAIFEAQRLKGYEKLNELKRKQEAEMGRVRRDSERDLAQIKNYYDTTEYQTDVAGQLRLRDLQAQQGRAYEHAKESKDENVAVEQDMYRKQYEDIKQTHDTELAKLSESSRQEYDKVRDGATQATEEAQKTFESKYQAHVADADNQILDLDARASEGILEVRRDTTQKLAAYSDRQSDPFYRMQDMNAHLDDEGDYYVLKATIPEHEQKHVSVSIKGNQLVLTGSRRSEEKLKIEPGHTQGTNAYQSYLETFPIDWPVNANKLTREFDGDQLTVRFPKMKDQNYRSQAQNKVVLPRARLERPKFPENLPHVSQDPYVESRDSIDKNRKNTQAAKNKGGDTLA